MDGAAAPGIVPAPTAATTSNSSTRRSHAARCSESCTQRLDWHRWCVPHCHRPIHGLNTASAYRAPLPRLPAR
eukprot:5770876-Alexandrium_andersonii.AAC.1